MATEDTSLDSLLSEAEAAPVQTIEPAAAQAEPQGDKEIAPAPPADAQAPTDEGPLVPRKALEDERRKRQDYEKRLADLERQIQASRQPPKQEAKQQAPAPDWWTDPEGAARQLQIQHQEAMFNTRLAIGEDIMAQKPDYAAAKEYFVQVADAAYQSGDKALLKNLIEHPHPAKYAYETGKRLLAEREIGPDPASYKERLRAELRAELQAELGGQPPQQVPQPPKAPAPKSLAGTTSTARDPQGRFASPSGPASLEDILG